MHIHPHIRTSASFVKTTPPVSYSRLLQSHTTRSPLLKVQNAYTIHLHGFASIVEPTRFFPHTILYIIYCFKRTQNTIPLTHFF